MPNIDITQRIEITPERFIAACSMAELMELDILLYEKLKNVTVHDVHHSEQPREQGGSPFMIKQKDEDL